MRKADIVINPLAFFLLLLLLLLPGCQRKPEGKYSLPQPREVREGSVTRLTEEIHLNTYEALWVDADYYILTGYDRQTDCFVHLYDRTSGLPVAHLVGKGRGPDELISVTSSWYADGILYLYSGTGNRSCFLDLGRWKQEKRYFLEELLPENENFGDILLGDLHYGVALWNRSFLDNTLRSHERIRLLDRHSGELRTYDEYPLDDRYKTWRMYNQPVVSVSPGFRKMVLTSSCNSGCIMEVFDLMPSIQLRKCAYFIEPSFKTDGNSFEPESDLRVGIISCSSDSQGFVVALDGETSVKASFDGEASTWFNKLIWFDWEGNPLKQVTVDFNLLRLALSDGKVYAFGRNRDQDYFIVKIES